MYTHHHATREVEAVEVVEAYHQACGFSKMVFELDEF
jgi:hypothetical protein